MCDYCTQNANTRVVLTPPRDGITVIVTNGGPGICSVCGNGLWPGQEPCEHKIAARGERG